jgi:hypothetical protein
MHVAHSLLFSQRASKNAVLSQVYVAMTAYLLLA